MSKTDFYRPFFKKILWDYDPEKISLEEESLFCWFLTRKINYDGLLGLRREDLLLRYQALDIDPAYKNLLSLL